MNWVLLVPGCLLGMLFFWILEIPASRTQRSPSCKRRPRLSYRHRSGFYW